MYKKPSGEVKGLNQKQSRQPRKQPLPFPCSARSAGSAVLGIELLYIYSQIGVSSRFNRTILSMNAFCQFVQKQLLPLPESQVRRCRASVSIRNSRLCLDCAGRHEVNFPQVMIKVIGDESYFRFFPIIVFSINRLAPPLLWRDNKALLYLPADEYAAGP